VPNIANRLTYIGEHIKPDDRRFEKALDLLWVLSPLNERHAIRLHLENLFLTYQSEIICEIFNQVKKENDNEF